MNNLISVYFMMFSPLNLGEACTIKLVDLLKDHVKEECLVFNLYGPAETTIGCTVYLVENTRHLADIPIGRPLSSYRVSLVDKFLQSVTVNQEGELYVGGVGVFAGYLHRDDLTAKSLIEIDGEPFYRTGDLVRLDEKGLLHYIGRKDYQVKLRGQRIELGEIERCLMKTAISACVVMKWNDDHLVAYVQSSEVNEDDLRKYCRSYLPPHMIPSKFIIMERLPLNANGKIDRKKLPTCDFPLIGSLSASSAESMWNVECKRPQGYIESIVHTLWCDALSQNEILIDTNIFSIGGHSLVLMQLYHQYKVSFELHSSLLPIADLFQYPTIQDHARLISEIVAIRQNDINDCWSPLHLIQSKRE